DPPVQNGSSGRACRNAPRSGAPEVPAEQGHPAGPLGQEGGAGRADKEDDGATGVAKPEVAAGEATHPAPAGAEGGEDRGGAVDERSMGVASPEGEAGAGEASLLPGEEAAEAGAPKGRVDRRWRSSARAELTAGAKEEGGGRGPKEEGKAGQVEHNLEDRARKFSGARRPERDTRHPEAIE
ncbi:uncharacterized protein Dana_GF26582, partial [Drosophila ananassae]